MAPAVAEAPEARTAQIVLDKLRRFRDNYPAWAKAFYRIRTKDERIERLILNPIQRRIGDHEARLLKKYGWARYLVLKGRQGGISTDQQARALHRIWSKPHTMAMTLAHTGDDTEKLFGITTRALGLFPSAWLPALGPKEAHEVSFRDLDSTFWTGTAGSKRTGRGLTLSRIHGSEFAFWDDPKGILNQLQPSMEGVPGSVIALETTASGHGSAAHEFWLAAEKGKNGYTAIFIPWWECDPARYQTPLMAPDELGKLEPEEQALIDRHGLTLPQIKWRRAKIESMGRPEFLKEYPEDPESCWITAGGLYYDAELLKELRTKAPEPRRKIMNGRLLLFDKPGEGERVIIGADVAEGVAGDRSTWVARAFPSWRLVAQFADDRTPPEALADLLNEWGRTYSGALIACEKNAHGITVIRRLRDHHKYPIGSLYHRVALDRTEDQRQEDSDRLGWVTSAESYPLMLSAGRELFLAAKKGRAGIPSAGVITDAFGVVRDKNGKVSLNGRDLLVAEMLAWIGRDQPPHRWEAF